MFPRKENQCNKNLHWPFMLWVTWTEHEESRKLIAISLWHTRQFLCQNFKTRRLLVENQSLKQQLVLTVPFFSLISFWIYFPGFKPGITQILTLWNFVKFFTSCSNMTKELVQYGMFPWCTIVLSTIFHIIVLESVLENTNHTLQDKWTDALAQNFCP